MFLIVSTVVLLAVLAVNHAVYGFGCWGAQPGGHVSAGVYHLQILLATGGIGWLVFRLWRSEAVVKPQRLVVISVLATISYGMFEIVGYRIGSTAHYQGPENLLAVLPIVLTTLAVGTYHWTPVAAGMRDSRQAGLQKPETGNPYQPPRG